MEIRGQSAHSTWYNGSIRRLNLLIASGAFLDVYNSGTNDFIGTTIENSGTFTWTEGNLTTDSTGGIKNMEGAEFLDQISGTVTIGSSGAKFENYGTYRKSGAGTTTVTQTFNNYSANTLEVSDGVFVLSGGDTNVAGAVVRATNSGLIQFASDYTVEDASGLEVGTVSQENPLDGTHSFSIPGRESFEKYGYELALGTLNLDGALGVNFHQSGGELDGSHTINGIWDWAGGDWDADASTGETTTIGSSGIVNIHPTSGYFYNRAITNNGTVNWTDADLITNTNGSFTNNGTFNDKLDHNHSFSGGTGFTNTGTYTKSGNATTEFTSTGLTSEGGDLNVNAGTLKLSGTSSFDADSSIALGSGSALQINSNTTIASGASVSGNGTLKLTSGTLSADGTIASGFEQTGGTLDGDLSFGRTWNITGGNFANDSLFHILANASGVLDKLGTDLNGTKIVVKDGASLEWRNGTIYAGNGGGIDVEGLMTLTGDLEINNDRGGTALLDVSGEFRKTAGSGTAIFELPVDVSGRFEVHAGTAELRRGGTSDGGLFDIWSGANLNLTNGYTFNNNTTVQNGGNLNLSGGAFTLNGSINLGQHATLSGGSVTGSHVLSGNILWTGASLDSNGTTEIASGSKVTFDTSGDVPLLRDVTVNGELLWQSGNVRGGEGTLTNNGKVNIATDGTFDNSLTGNYDIVNNGAFNKTGGTGTTTIAVPFTNNGTVSAQTGQFHFTDTLTIGSDGKLGGGIKFDSPLTLPTGSTLAGNGTITGNITTGGKVGPGNSIGSLTVAGDLTLLSTATSFYEIDVSTTPTSADFLSVTGTLNLNGLLTYDFLSAIVPSAVESTYTLITAGTLSGAFSNIANGDRIFNPGKNASFVVNYGTSSSFSPNSVVFSGFEFTPVPEPSTFTLLLAGLGLIMWQTRRRRR